MYSTSEIRTQTTTKANGYVLHEDTFRVVIATGFIEPSDNRKTGPMVQVWILVKSEDPVAAVKSGKDGHIFGNCPLRGDHGKERACYVNVGQAPLAIWKAWRRGSYPAMQDDQLFDIFAGKFVRFGAYGDPTAIPLAMAQRIADVSAGWTGYTHQWRRPVFQGWRKLIMASVETTKDMQVANSMGWRTFRVIPLEHGSDHHKGEIICPSERGVQCADCLMCSGTSARNSTLKVSIAIPAHGSGAGFVS